MLLHNSCVRVVSILACTLALQSFKSFAETDPLLEGATVTAPTPATTSAPTSAPTPVTPPSLKSQEEPTPAPIPIIPESNPVNEAISSSVTRSELFLDFGLSFNSYHMSGVGLTTAVPFSPGFYYGVGYSTLQESGHGMLVQFSESKNRHKNFTTVSPAVVELSQIRGEIMHRAPLGEKWSSFLGYGYFSREATVTTPSQVVGEHRSHGPVVGLEFRRRQSQSDKWRLLSMALLRLPVFFHERDSRSGAHIGSTEIELALGMFYRVNKSLEVGVNAKFRGGLHYYKGPGSRGVSDATERDLSFFIPLEVRMHF